MQWTGPIQTLSGFGILFDPSVVSLRQPADAETLEAMAADGSVLSWPALGEEIIVTVIIDEELPARLAAVATREADVILRVPSGAAWLADATCLDQVDDNRSDGPMQRVAVVPGDYLATAYLLHWPERDANATLRRAAGTLPLALRDGLGLATFFLGAITLVGLPVYLIGRALDDGPSGVAEGLGVAALFLTPLWIVLLAAWRLPWVRRADRADRAIALRFPDVVVHLQRT